MTFLVAVLLLAASHLALASLFILLLHLLRLTRGGGSAAFQANAWLAALLGSILLAPLGFLPLRPESQKIVVAEGASLKSITLDGQALPVEVSSSSDLSSLAIIASIIVAIWLIGTIVTLIDLTIAVRQSQHLAATATPIEQDTLSVEGSESIGVALASHQAIRSPMLIGWRHPLIIIPLAARLADDLPWVIAHELAHHERRDMTWALVQRVAAAIVWWSPPARYISRRLSTEREHDCDDRAGRENRFAYARGLARQSAQGVLHPGLDVERRVRRLIAPGAVIPPPQPWLNAIRLVMTGSIAAAAVWALAPEWILIERPIEGNWISK